VEVIFFNAVECRLPFPVSKRRPLTFILNLENKKSQDAKSGE
jgi:hypothetical protein